MCSRLQVRLSTDGSITAVKVGDPVPFHSEGQDWQGIWGTTQFGDRLVGFARVETVREKWLTRGWQTCTVPIANFAEGHDRQRWADTGEALVAALHKAGEVVVITRQATPAEYRKLDHHRMPVQVIDGRMALPSKGGPGWLTNRSQEV